jgi:hypothetical protein
MTLGRAGRSTLVACVRPADPALGDHVARLSGALNIRPREGELEPGTSAPHANLRRGASVPDEVRIQAAGVKIVSGGQSGADRAALDFAIDHGIPHGGWCPQGRKAKDGTIDQHYQLKETHSANYAQRTEWKVRDGDGTVVFSIAAVLTGGSKKTVELARRHEKPTTPVSANSASTTTALPN